MLVLIGLFTACQSDIEFVDSYKEDTTHPKRIDPQNAIKKADSILSKMNRSTRSVERKVASIETIGSTNRDAKPSGDYLQYFKGLTPNK